MKRAINKYAFGNLKPANVIFFGIIQTVHFKTGQIYFMNIQMPSENTIPRKKNKRTIWHFEIFSLFDMLALLTLMRSSYFFVTDKKKVK